MAKKYTLKKFNETGLIETKVDETRFSIDYRNILNNSQFEAVSAVKGNFLLIAGAGTGKTRTLVYRVARLIELGYPPESILLLTFTRKASKEMLNRAAMLLDSRCTKINGGTFHSFANLTLRKYGKLAGIDSSFTILDQSDSEDAINLIRGQINIDAIKKRFPKKSTIFKIISLSKNTDTRIEDIVEVSFPHFLEFSDKIVDIAKVYEAYKRKNSMLDYDDLLIYLLKFLQNENQGAKALLAKIRFVMVDEYQDTNYLQAEIVKSLTKYNANCMVVGDDSQSIYSFRGANFKNIIEFPKHFPNTTIIKLEENYRSTQTILDMANFVINSAIEKYPKNLYTRKTSDNLPAIISATNENMQSRFVVNRILELREEGTKLEDIAVLFRSSFHSFDLEIELNKANIPYIKVGGMKFMESAHVKDLLAFMRVTANPKDLISWYRILMLHEGIGPKKAQAILNYIESNAFSFDKHTELPVPAKMYDKIINLFEIIKEAKNKSKSPTEKAEYLYTYYDPLFKSTYDDFNKRKKDIETFINISQNYKSIDSFLADMALEPPQDSVSDLEPGNNEDEFLTLTTIHSAKGLEWHSVFLIHAMEGFFPSSQASESTEALEEERRLMYVAVTRAKEHLYVCYPMHIFDRYSGFTLSKPSRFIQGIGEDIAEEWLLDEE